MCCECSEKGKKKKLYALQFHHTALERGKCGGMGFEKHQMLIFHFPHLITCNTDGNTEGRIKVFFFFSFFKLKAWAKPTVKGK